MKSNPLPPAALSALLLAGLAACGDRSAIPATTGEAVALPCDNQIEELTHTMTVNGVREAWLQADEACLWENADTIVVERFRLVLHDQGTGIEKATVTGQSGVLDLRTRRMRATGNAVLIIPAQGRRIESEQLLYDPAANLMRSDTTTFMYLPDRIIEGSGFESDLEFLNVRVRQLRTRPPNDGAGAPAPLVEEFITVPPPDSAAAPPLPGMDLPPAIPDPVGGGPPVPEGVDPP